MCSIRTACPPCSPRLAGGLRKRPARAGQASNLAGLNAQEEPGSPRTDLKRLGNSGEDPSMGRGCAERVASTLPPHLRACQIAQASLTLRTALAAAFFHLLGGPVQAARRVGLVVVIHVPALVMTNVKGATDGAANNALGFFHCDFIKHNDL